MTYNQVTFLSSTHYCELAIESRENLYLVRFWNNGDRDLAHNCYKVAVLPVSILSTRLLEAVAEWEGKIHEYMHTTDTLAGSRLFWEIKDGLAKLASEEESWQ
jgi:hypothetical protein